MSAIKDGGPAFPLGDQRSQSGDLTHYAESGMSLRDYFAAAALQGILACTRDYGENETRDSRCERAYRYADAMLRVRGAA